jgi:4'-phosphopantetheinyl transferase
VRIFLADPGHQDERDLALAWSALDDQERAHADRLERAADRQVYVVAHGLLRAVLAQRTGMRAADLRFSRAPHGRPELANPTHDGAPPVRFNLSHTQGLVGCAVTATEDVAVGFDVEEMRAPAPLEVAPNHFSSRELVDLRQLPPPQQDDRFYTLWALKESYIKGRGLGVALPLDSFSVAPTPRGRAILTTPETENPTPWTLRWWRLRRHAVALAIAAPPGRLRVTFSVGIRLAALPNSAVDH